jgi:hypothetical protein
MPKTKGEDTGSTEPAQHRTLKPADHRHVAREPFPEGGERIQFIHRTYLAGDPNAVLSKSKGSIEPLNFCAREECGK